MDLTEAEDTSGSEDTQQKQKKRWQEYTEELNKKRST